MTMTLDHVVPQTLDYRHTDEGSAHSLFSAPHLGSWADPVFKFAAWTTARATT